MTNNQKKVDKLKKLEDSASQPDQMMNVAQQIVEEIGDKDWAKNVFEKSIELSKNWYDPIDMLRMIAQTIVEQLDDSDWADKLIESALDSKNISAKNKLTCAYFYTCFPDNSQFIDKSKKLYADIIKLSKDLTSEDLYQSASTIFYSTNDKELAISYLAAAENRAESPWDYIFIAQEYAALNEIEKAQKIAELGLSKCEDDDEKTSLKDTISGFLG